MEITFYHTTRVTKKDYDATAPGRAGWTELTVEEADGRRTCIVLHSDTKTPPTIEEGGK